MISKRLNSIISMVEPCGLLADIGCDHGYVCIRTVQNGQAKQAIASDIAEGPLRIASENIREAGLSDEVTTVLADGLSGIPEDARPECIIMTGIGGLLMRRILKELRPELSTPETSVNDPRFSELKQMVLGPQSDIDAVRHLLLDELHFSIESEVSVEEDGKFYTLLDVRPGKERAPEADPYTESQYLYGKHINPGTKDVYAAFLQQQKKILVEAKNGALRGCSFGAAQALRDIRHRMELVEEALKGVEG